jgi:hypothetical protein
MCLEHEEQIMKHLYTILTGIIVISLIACSKNGPGKAAVSGAGGSATQGTIDGGGGNVLNDKMLESYIVDPKELSGFELLSPLLKNLESVLNDSDVELNFYVFFKNVLGKSWYLVPTEIIALANDKIGVPFNKGTVQAAFQTFDAVWIDENAFDKLSLEERAKLILHEIVMGLKILKFESDDKLYAAVNLPRSLPQPEDEIINPTRLDLKNITPTDVAQVRTVTRRLWEHKDLKVQDGFFSDGFSRREFGSMMIQHDFERTIYKEEKLNIGLYQLIAGYKIENIDNWISQTASSGHGLSADYEHTEEQFENSKKEILSAKSNCEFNIRRIGGNQAEVTLHITPIKITGDDNLLKERKTTLVVNVPDALYYVFNRDTRIYQANNIVKLIGKGKSSTSETEVLLHFDGDTFRGVDAHQRVLSSMSLDESSPYYLQKDDTFDEYSCGSGSQLPFEK